MLILMNISAHVGYYYAAILGLLSTMVGLEILAVILTIIVMIFKYNPADPRRRRLLSRANTLSSAITLILIIFQTAVTVFHSNQPASPVI